MPQPRTPTAVKKLKGTAQPCRLNKSEPQPTLGCPPCPDHLSDRAKAAYAEYAEDLQRMRVLTLADGKILEQLAQAYADWRDAVEFLDEHGTTYITIKQASDGSEVKEYKAFPQVSHRNDADKRLRMLEKDCGLTPSDRAKVSAVEGKEASPWDRVIQ